MLQRFAQGWQTWRTSEEAKARKDSCQKKEAGHVRLSKQIKKLNDKQAKAKKLDNWIREDASNWYKLRNRDKSLWTEFAEGKISEEIRQLRQQQQPQFRGAAEQIHAASQIESSAAQRGGINRP